MKKTFKIVCSSMLSLLLATGALAGCKDSGSSSSEANFTWTGLTEATVAAGDPFDLMEGVKVTNAAGTDITSSVTVLTLDENEQELTELGVYDYYEDFDYHITGVYTVYYMATDGGEKEFESREVTVEKQHNLSNGDFGVENNTGFFDWMLDMPGGNTTMEKVTEGTAKKPKFNITNLGNAWWSLQYISSCNLKKGETYKITVNAKSAAGKSVAFGFENPSNGYAMMQGLTAYTLGESYADYVSYYTANADYTNAKAVLYFGYMLEEDTAKAYDLTINSIKIEKVEKCNEVTFTGVDNATFYAESEALKAFIANPKAGVTAKNGETDLTDRITVKGEVSEKIKEGTNFTLAYVVENQNGPSAIAYRTISVRLQKEHPYSLINGTFDENIDFWTVDINASDPGPTGASMEWVAGDDNEGAMKVTVVKPTGDVWRIQTYQNINVEKGKHYLATLRMKASRARTVMLEIGAQQVQLNLTTEYQDFEVAYIAPSSASVRFNIQLGGGGSENNNSVIYIDSVAMALDADQTEYKDWQMFNPEYDHGMRNWGYEGAVTFTPGKEGDDSYVAAEITENTDAAWRIQLRQDGKSFENGKTYKLVIRAKSTVERDVTVEIRKDGYAGNKSNTFRFTTEVQTFEYEFTFNDDNATGLRVGMLLGGAFGGSTVTIYQFEIVEVPAEA